MAETDPARVDHGAYADDYIRSVLASVRTIAMVGASPSWNRPSTFSMKYLQAKGYRVIPVNPRATGEEILGETVYAALKDVPVTVDMVGIFRTSGAARPITDAQRESCCSCCSKALPIAPLAPITKAR